MLGHKDKDHQMLEKKKTSENLLWSSSYDDDEVYENELQVTFFYSLFVTRMWTLQIRIKIIGFYCFTFLTLFLVSPKTFLYFYFDFLVVQKSLCIFDFYLLVFEVTFGLSKWS